MDTTLIYRIVVVILLIFSSVNSNITKQENVKLHEQVLQLGIQLDSLAIKTDSLQTRVENLYKSHPSIKSKKMGLIQVCPELFNNFIISRGCNTHIHTELMGALESYSGPKVRVNSLRRFWSKKSKHYCGKAADFELEEDVVSWLCTLEGIEWCEKHDIKFYIEGKPRSRGLDKYKQDELYSRYVFENPKATGDHIHIELI